MADQEIKREKMYGWYDPGHLLETGIRVGIAQIFGEFLDRRELFGDRNTAKAAKFDDAHDYSRETKEGLWIDFVADTGDGWEPTYAIARLLARGGLRFRGADGQWAGIDNRTPPSRDQIETQRGEVLIFGGDEVYSTASQKAYESRFVAPFKEAAKTEGAAEDLKKAKVYALPGNHDWYDGLNAFMTMFVTRRPGGPHEGFGAGRFISGRRAPQTRSYFALKLPGDWWLLGADAQLSGYIDQGQIAFFDDLAQREMNPGSNIILCAATPSWSYVHLDGPPRKMFRNHGYLEDVVTGLVHDKEKKKDARRHHLRLVLTGDAHHYARYVEQLEETKEEPDAPQTDIPQDARCYLTWGGGGAFMHPTHQLDNVSFAWDYPPPPPVSPLLVTKDTAVLRRCFSKRHIYPDEKTSRKLARPIPLFGIWNLKFSFLMFAFGLVVAWALAGAADLAGKRLPDTVRNASSVCEAVGELFFLLMTFPWVLLTCAALAGALVYFSAAQRMLYRALTGIAHFCAYMLSFFAIFLFLARWRWVADFEPPCDSVWLVVLTAAGTAIVAPLIMGCYLAISLIFRRHWNEAFSSLRIKGYKGFLRLHIKDGVVTVFPIAMDKVPRRGEGRLETRLIERPIRIEGSASSPPASKPKRKPRAPRRPAADA